MRFYRHKKRGTIYEVLTTGAKLQCSAAQEVEDRFLGQEWTIYRDLNSRQIYIRLTAEFMDGRFEQLPEGLARD